jgi:hypothetical protein
VDTSEKKSILHNTHFTPSRQPSIAEIHSFFT